MGKDILLDNGKKVQSSMTRYWKQQKTRERQRDKKGGSRHPTSNPTQQRQQPNNQHPTQDSDYTKWKTHQQNMVTKKYTQKGGEDKQEVTQKVEIPKVETEGTIMREFEEKEREKVIPGYSSKSEIHKKIHKTTVMKSKDLPASKNQIPAELKGLFGSPEELQKILKANKLKNIEKLKNQKKKMENHQKMLQKQREEDPFEKTLQDEQYNILKKEEQEKEDEQVVMEVEEQPQSFFKSDILNKILAGEKPDMKGEGTEKQKQKQKKMEKEEEVPEEPRAYRFIPRAVILKEQRQ